MRTVLIFLTIMIYVYYFQFAILIKYHFWYILSVILGLFVGFYKSRNKVYGVLFLLFVLLFWGVWFFLDPAAFVVLKFFVISSYNKLKWFIEFIISYLVL